MRPGPLDSVGPRHYFGWVMARPPGGRPHGLRKVILRYGNGRVAPAFSPLFEEGSDSLPTVDLAGEALLVSLSELKALFFVRTFTGNPSYDAPRDAGGSPAGGARLVLLHFRDGERMLGEVGVLADLSRGFYFTVLDPENNNLLVYVNPQSLAEPPEEFSGTPPP